MELLELMKMVRCFHEKHDFANNNGSDMNFRMLLMMEEVGELAECLTKGKGMEDIREELADIFILLLGHCVVLDIDIEKVFLDKMDKIMQRKAIKVKNGIRVTEYRGEGTEEI
ncbi:MAG: MazG nucleotide pyrophosphohydrolase domain-containing protein [Candidatus Thermoplasmatota archaeon]|nr:MazG nucleotide pyrophosphohydrolase domain-containing protein [Candidatus Thermoplasmatota archaeon]